MTDRLPQIRGKELLGILKKDGWQEVRKANHGIWLVKEVDGKKRLTLIPQKDFPLPQGVLGQILGPKQTGLGREGLVSLIKKYK